MISAVTVTETPVTNTKCAFEIMQMVIDPTTGEASKLDPSDPNKMMQLLVTGLVTVIRKVEDEDDEVVPGQIMGKAMNLLNDLYVSTDAELLKGKDKSCHTNP